MPGWPSRREDGADHIGVALAARIGAQFSDLVAPPLDFRRAFTFVSGSGEHQAVDVLRHILRELRRADAARGFTEEVKLAAPGLGQQHRHSRLEVLDTTGDIGVVAGTAGIAEAVMIHGPDVEAGASELVHERIVLARHLEVITGTRRQRRAVHQEQHRQRGRAGSWRADTLAPQVEFHIAFVGPVFTAPDFGGCGLRRRSLRVGRRHSRNQARARNQTRAEAEAGALDDAAACNHLVGHSVLP